MLLNQCSDTSLPFTAQLPTETANCHGRRAAPPLGRAMAANKLGQSFARLRKRLGITRKLTPHDLRRTMARAVYRATHDLRDVQSLLGHQSLTSTMWYLQDDLHRVNLSVLELAKLTPATKGVQ